MARPADACQCDVHPSPAEADAAALEGAEVAFDGWVVDDGRRWECVAPSAAPAKAG